MKHFCKKIKRQASHYLPQYGSRMVMRASEWVASAEDTIDPFSSDMFNLNTQKL